MKVYTGIGPRRTPQEVLAQMAGLAIGLRANGWTCRSGHAAGADQAFETGASYDAEVYLPRPGYENHAPILARYVQPAPTQRAYAVARMAHPAWDRCDDTARRLHARNSHVVLGRACRERERSEFVVSWTPRSHWKGGTAQTIRVAWLYEVPVYNLAVDEDVAHLAELFGLA